MNRKLKYRVWCLRDNEWEDAEYLLTKDGDLKYFCRGFLFSLKDKDHIVQQFTGYFDQNGREIYEGDIIEVDFSTGHERDSSYCVHGDFQVCFEGGEWRVKNEDEDLSLCGYFKYSTIIGNIFENPNLLKN